MCHLHEHVPDKRRCLADREAFWFGEDRSFYEAILWFKEEPYPDSWRLDSDDVAPKTQDADDDLIEDHGAEDEKFTETPTIKLVALKSVRRQEVEVAKV